MKNLGSVLNNFRSLVIFVLLAVILTLVFGSIYYTGQQVFRSLANDPQIQVVGQLEGILKQDIPLEAILGQEQQIDISENPELFVMIFDKDKKLAGSTALIGDTAPTVPDGVFEKASLVTGNRFTWEPKEGVRVAAVLKQVDDKGYVLAGKSLKETDFRIRSFATLVVVGWTASLLAALALSVVLKPRRSLAIIEETNVTVVEEKPEETL